MSLGALPKILKIWHHWQLYSKILHLAFKISIRIYYHLPAFARDAILYKLSRNIHIFTWYASYNAEICGIGDIWPFLGHFWAIFGQFFRFFDFQRCNFHSNSLTNFSWKLIKPRTSTYHDPGAPFQPHIIDIWVLWSKNIKNLAI